MVNRSLDHRLDFCFVVVDDDNDDVKIRENLFAVGRY